MSEALTDELRADFPRLAFKPPVLSDNSSFDLCGECGQYGEWDHGEMLSSVQFFKCHDCRRVWVDV